jgi:hypothetical protein
MDDFFKHDSRIDDNTALRDLEKKVHWLMYQLGNAGSLCDLSGNPYAIPDDFNVQDIQNDAMEVARTQQFENKLTSGCGALQKKQQ